MESSQSIHVLSPPESHRAQAEVSVGTAGIPADRFLELGFCFRKTALTKEKESVLPGNKRIVAVDLHRMTEGLLRAAQSSLLLVNGAEIGPGRGMAGMGFEKLLVGSLSFQRLALILVKDGQVETWTRISRGQLDRSLVCVDRIGEPAALVKRNPGIVVADGAGCTTGGHQGEQAGDGGCQDGATSAAPSRSPA